MVEEDYTRHHPLVGLHEKYPMELGAKELQLLEELLVCQIRANFEHSLCFCRISIRTIDVQHRHLPKCQRGISVVQASSQGIVRR